MKKIKTIKIDYDVVDLTIIEDYNLLDMVQEAMLSILNKNGWKDYRSDLILYHFGKNECPKTLYDLVFEIYENRKKIEIGSVLAANQEFGIPEYQPTFLADCLFWSRLTIASLPFAILFWFLVDFFGYM